MKTSEVNVDTITLVNIALSHHTLPFSLAPTPHLTLSLSLSRYKMDFRRPWPCKIEIVEYKREKI